MVLITFILLFFVFLIIIGYKKWIINYIKILRTYRNIPCPPNRLPLLGNIFNLPLSPYSKKKIHKKK
jgi:hypothetical protein